MAYKKQSKSHLKRYQTPTELFNALKNADVYVGPKGIQNEVSGNCGAEIVSELENATTPDIIISLAKYSEDKQKFYSQIIFSDNHVNEKRWKDLKEAAYKSPWVLNPNTGNKTRFYIITPKKILKVWNNQFKK